MPLPVSVTLASEIIIHLFCVCLLFFFFASMFLSLFSNFFFYSRKVYLQAFANNKTGCSIMLTKHLNMHVSSPCSPPLSFEHYCYCRRRCRCYCYYYFVVCLLKYWRWPPLWRRPLQTFHKQIKRNIKTCWKIYERQCVCNSYCIYMYCKYVSMAVTRQAYKLHQTKWELLL